MFSNSAAKRRDKAIIAYGEGERNEEFKSPVPINKQGIWMMKLGLYFYLDIDKYISESYIKNNYQKPDIYEKTSVL